MNKLHGVNVKCYTAKSMTGRPADELVKESATVKSILNARGIIVLDPVAAENVKKEHGILQNTGDKLKGYWKRDKQMIRDAHVVLDITGPAKSEGTAHEIGYARYALWKPVIRIFPADYSKISVAKYEDDIIVDSVDEAAEIIVAMWGNRWKRITWRINLLWRCLPRWIVYQLNEWK
jgi:nucleoside 2-deoxyribosyltransferase